MRARPGKKVPFEGDVQQPFRALAAQRVVASGLYPGKQPENVALTIARQAEELAILVDLGLQAKVFVLKSPVLLDKLP